MNFIKFKKVYLHSITVILRLIKHLWKLKSTTLAFKIHKTTKASLKTFFLRNQKLLTFYFLNKTKVANLYLAKYDLFSVSTRSILRTMSLFFVKTCMFSKP